MAGAGEKTQRQRRNPDKTRRRILDAARTLAAERGPESLRVSDVAHAAGVNRTTAYQHFRTRDDLVAAVMGEFGYEVTNMLTENHGRKDLIDFMLRYLIEHQEIARLWTYLLLSDVEWHEEEGWQRYHQYMRTLASSPHAPAGIDVEMLARLLQTSVLGASLMIHRQAADEKQRKRISDRYIREFTRLLLYGAINPEEWPELAGQFDAGKAAAPRLRAVSTKKRTRKPDKENEND